MLSSFNLNKISEFGITNFQIRFILNYVKLIYIQYNAHKRSKHWHYVFLLFTFINVLFSLTNLHTFRYTSLNIKTSIQFDNQSLQVLQSLWL